MEQSAPFRNLYTGWPLLLALVLLLAPGYLGLAQDQWQEENYSHGPVILLVCLWLAWREWPRLYTLPTLGKSAGAWLLATPAALLYVVGRSQSIPLLEVPGQIGLLMALVFYFKGFPGLRTYWFLFFFMLFLVPIPGSLLYSLTHALKANVSVIAESLLFTAGYPIAREGVTLTIGQYQLLVADACSGMNSIISLTALGLIYLYINPLDSWWRKGILLLMIIPIAVFANICRVILLILITYYFGDEAGQGFAHNLTGMTLFISALSALYLLDSLLRHTGGKNVQSH